MKNTYPALLKNLVMMMMMIALSYHKGRRVKLASQIDILFFTLTESFVFLCIIWGKEGKLFSPKENLILYKIFIKITSDQIVGTDQARVQFWVQTTTEYNKMCDIANIQNKDEQEGGLSKFVERSLDSLKSRWIQKILPAANKFQGICETNPPTSGELRDDATMDKYYGRIRESYSERAKANT